MKEVEFDISICPYGEIVVYTEVSDSDYKLLKKYAKQYEEEYEPEFCECEPLSDLYQRICEEAYDEMANGVYDDDAFIKEAIGGDYDFDKVREYLVENYEIAPQWPSFGEED